MSDTKKTTEQWKAEQQRAERKARLSGMKDKDGGKKQIKSDNPVLRIIVVAVLILALIGTGLWAAVRTGLPQRHLTAATIGSIEVKPIDVNYYYYITLNSYGIDPSTPDGQNMLQSPSGDETHPTLEAYLKDTALQSVQQDVMLSEEAKKQGISMTEDDQEIVDNYVANFVSGATQQGLTVDNYLIKAFGPGMNESALRMIAERVILADRYRTEKQDSFTFTAEELDKTYQENPDTYDVVNYRLFVFETEADEDATEAEIEEAKKAAKGKAEEMLAKITDEASFQEQAIAYASKEDAVAYRTRDASLYTNRHKSAVTNVVQKTWLFDEARKAQDKAVLESSTSYYVVMFIDRFKPEFNRIDIRHILISANRTSASSEEIAEAKSKAESILATYQAGEKTEEAFAELAVTNSADSSASQGGLYQDVFPGQMVKEFNDWCFDAARKPGDTDIVQTDFGFHIMYFVDESGIDWEINVQNDLRNKEMDTLLSELREDYPYQTQSFGYRFVG